MDNNTVEEPQPSESSGFESGYLADEYLEEYLGPTVTVNKDDKDLYDSTRHMHYLARMVQQNPDVEVYGQKLAEEVITFLKLAGWTK